jgi:hypothetical protein
VSGVSVDAKGNRNIGKSPRTVETPPSGFSFLNVKTTGTSAQLTWTAVGSGTRYLVFSQELYGAYYTAKTRFQFIDLEPGKKYSVFVLAVELGPRYIAFTEFETRL